jgi:simple sugar transport system permease protein
MMFTMLIAGIDLSVNSTANLAAILAGLTMVKLMPGGVTTGPMWLYILLALAIGIVVGALCGLLNGFLIAVVGIPAILATLGTMTLYKGLAVGITKGSAVYGYPEPFLYPGNGFFLGIPIPFIIFIFLAVIAWLILERTTLGFRIYMLGTNAKASRFSGVNNRSVIIQTHIFTGIMSAIAGLVILSRTNSANADYGSSYVLVTILTAVLGGVSVSGGFGRIWSVVLAIFSLQQLSTGFNMLLFQYKGSNFFRDFAWGILLLLVMVINYYQSKGKLKNPFRKKQTVS